MNRRESMKIVGLGAAGWYLAGCQSLGKTPTTEKSAVSEVSDPFFSTMSPIDRSLPEKAPKIFSGDISTLAHKILWDKAQFVKSHPFPEPSEDVPLLIVGGGASGLISAYFLRHHKPIILEQAPRLGGNSRGESWLGIDYGIGASYFAVPEKGSDIDKFLDEVGLTGKYRIHSTDDPIWVDGKNYPDVWQTGTSEKNKDQFVRLTAHFRDMIKNANGLRYPELPAPNQEARDYANELDKISFYQYVEKFLKEPIDPHLYHILEHYFWSACASSGKEVSAAVGLNFFVNDSDKIAVTSGGNAAITEATLKVLVKELPKSNLRPSSLVYDVRVKQDGVYVSYLDTHEKVTTIRAQKVIMSCPKFICAKLIEDLEPQRKQVIKNISYRSYIVANVMVDKHVDDFFYDLYDMKSDEMKISDTKKAAEKQKFTDFVYGNFPNPDPARTVITFYRGYPYEGARKEIYEPGTYDNIMKDLELQLADIFPRLGLAVSNIKDIRLARWGHPLPVSKVGNLHKGYVDVLRKPFKEKVFFAEQDNWCIAAFECAFFEANATAKLVEASLTSA